MSDSDSRPEMQPEAQRQNQPEPSLQPARVTPEQREAARLRLARTKGNPSQQLVNGSRVFDKEVREKNPPSAEEKLILAEFYGLLADHIDPDSAVELDEQTVQAALRAVEKTKKAALGQALPQLRDLEETAVELDLWRQNGNFAGGNLPEQNTTAYLVPRLTSEMVKFLRRELMDANDRPTTSKRIAMLLTRVEDFADSGQSPIEQSDLVLSRMEPLLRAVAENDAHMFAGAPLGSGLEHLNELIGAFGSAAAQTAIQDLDLLAALTLVANQLRYRAPYSELGEVDSPEVSMAAAYAAQLTKRQDSSADPNARKPHFKMPELTQTADAAYEVVHQVATKQDQEKFKPTGVNLVESVDGKLYPTSGATLFPREGLEAEDKTQLVVRQQTPAKMTRNRIKAHLKQLLYLREGMPEPDEQDLHKEIKAYLQKLKDEHQIKDFKITRCRIDPKDPTQYQVEIGIAWNVDVEDFVVRLYSDSATGESANSN